MSDEDRSGFWYWITLTKPALHFIVKSMGGKAEKEADAAMEYLGSVSLVFIVIGIIVFVIWGLGKLFTIW